MQIFPECGVYLELWGEIGVLSYCWVLAPLLSRDPVRRTCTVWLGLLRVVIYWGWHLLGSTVVHLLPCALLVLSSLIFRQKG